MKGEKKGRVKGKKRKSHLSRVFGPPEQDRQRRGVRRGREVGGKRTNQTSPFVRRVKNPFSKIGAGIGQKLGEKKRPYERRGRSSSNKKGGGGDVPISGVIRFPLKECLAATRGGTAKKEKVYRERNAKV